MKTAIITILATLILSTTAWAASVQLQWDANLETDLTGYKVYFGNYSGNTTSFVPVGVVSVPATMTAVTINDLSTLKKWYFRATALNATQESEYSNLVQVVFIRKPVNLRFQNITIR